MNYLSSVDNSLYRIYVCCLSHVWVLQVFIWRGRRIPKDDFAVIYEHKILCTGLPLKKDFNCEETYSRTEGRAMIDQNK